jgi:molybdopterin adenylyltransferase
MINAAVVTISDTCYEKLRRDVSGPAVSERLEQMGWTVLATEILPDETDRIAERLRALADGGKVSAIFTTGGTGVARRDVTPEAVRAVIGKEIPGFGELMRSKGLQHTALASLSRSMAGTRGSTLIVALPGSPKAAIESLNAIVDLVPHVLELLRGETAHSAATQTA